jgi:MoxR-vWA-beta-propeller ternary system domain bpX5
LKSNSLQITWHFRGEPRVPVAVVASGETAKELARKLLASDHTKWTSLRGVATPDAIVLLGEAESLPWVDGVSYLGSDDRAPHLLLPTNREPNVPADLLQQALVEQSPFPPPLAIIETRNTVVSLSQARELSRDALRSWLLTAT